MYRNAEAIEEMAMQRPVMNPMDVVEPVRAPRWKIPWKQIWLGVKLVVRVLLADPMDLRRRGLRVEEGTPLQRLLFGILYRMAFIPLLVILAVAALVYVGTHPRVNVAQLDPAAVGVYFQSVDFTSENSAHLQGWLVPSVDARQILAEHERALGKKSPAVLLVHGYGATRSQLLALIKPLHDQGFTVLAMASRGEGSPQSVGLTFGLSEAQDVHSAIELLRLRPGVDGNRIAVVGVGTGANAVLLDADREVALGAMVLDSPIVSGDDAIARFIAPSQPMLHWMAPLCKWAFEIAYEKDLDEIDLQRHKHAIQSVNVLVVSDLRSGELQLTPVTVTRVVRFLNEKLGDRGMASASAQ
jgi:hypothetical protein